MDYYDRMLRNRKDTWLILLSLENIALMMIAAGLTPWMSQHFSIVVRGALYILCGLGILYLYLVNYQCISHYHIHKPFFKHKTLNHLFSIVNTLSLGVPQSLYHVHHQYHHKGNNDRRSPETQSTVDFASSYRFSKDPNIEEDFVPFTLKSVFRAEITPLVKIGATQGRLPLIILEFAALFGFWAILIHFSWKNFVFYYLPLWFFGQVLNYAENYVEHHGASHTNRLDDSVSCYNRVYNFLWFNNGYHQEHHYRPSVHWTELPSVKALMLDDSKRRIVPYCHLFNLPIIQKRIQQRQKEKLNPAPEAQNA